MSSPIVSIKNYVLVWASLMILLALTWGVAEMNLGIFNTIAAMAIAAVKMLLVILFFMHVRHNPRLTWLFVAAGFVWLSFMILLTMTDYLTRGLVRSHNKIISFWNEKQGNNR